MATVRIGSLRRFVPAPASRVQAVLAVVAAAAIVAVLVLHPPRAGADLAGPVEPAPPTPDPTPVAVTPAQLSGLAGTLGHPVYWVGPRAGTTYELRRAAGGNVFLRYLPDSVPVGDEGAYLTVGTYPVVDAFRATQAFASGGSVGSRPIAGGGIALYRLAQPTNVYVAYPGLDYQLEVFAPSPADALRLATSGALRPVR